MDEDKNGEGNNLLVLKREGGEFEDEEGEDLKIIRKLSCFVVESICWRWSPWMEKLKQVKIVEL